MSRIRRIIPLVVRALLIPAAITLQSCAVHDGPFEQVSGRQADTEVLHKLEAEHANMTRVIEALGPPSDRRRSGDKVILVYKSVRVRTSKEEVVGVTVASSGQQFIQTWELEFEGDALVRTRPFSEIIDR